MKESNSPDLTKIRNVTPAGVPDFWARLCAAPRRLLALDYDGTLAPFHADRLRAKPAPGIMEAVRTIRELPNQDLIFVSGRPVNELLGLIGEIDVPIIGSHGWEIRDRDGEINRSPLTAEQRTALADAWRIIEEHGWTADSERKPAGVATHVRGMADREGLARLQQVRAAWQPLIDGHDTALEIRAFNGGLELRACGRDKGVALAEYLQDVPPDTLPVFLGDDETDEDAFAALPPEGIGIKVGPLDAPTAAAGRLPDIHAVVRLLEHYVRRFTGAPEAVLTSNEHEIGARDSRLVVVSNRLPVRVHERDGEFKIVASSGGLVSALTPILKERGGLWIGWLGADDPPEVERLLAESSRDTGYDLLPINLAQEEIERYYLGFSNEAIWPLFHDLIDRSNFGADDWPAYEQVNRKFARVIANRTTPQDIVWVQDYHLMLAASFLRELGAERRLVFFLHIPFPPSDIFMKLPWRRQILEGLLQFDLVGFQTVRDRRNFHQCVRTMFPAMKSDGYGYVRRMKVASRSLLEGAFPISIDFAGFERRAAEPAVAEQAQRIRGMIDTPSIMLGVDRLDYTKGIPRRLEAFGRALGRHPELRRNISFVQVVVPSRTKVGEYQRLKGEIDRLVGEINGRYSQPGWAPITYLFRSLHPVELLGYYRTADIALVTPLKDGMNLVAKEYCAANLEEHGVLILSEFAGAAAQLSRHALTVNPYDLDGVADAIFEAYEMKPEARRRRMRRLRRSIRKHDIFYWVDTFLDVASSGRPYESLALPEGGLTRRRSGAPRRSEI
jgi:trehalose 6-phosphate synthase/phosphatase